MHVSIVHGLSKQKNDSAQFIKIFLRSVIEPEQQERNKLGENAKNDTATGGVILDSVTQREKDI
ncbi:hypothetical protein B1H58_12750 [Pantoea alhagi]|uniref:Uncharacterized protein n=1 Tax=Pantoea alhagi TaxID=1891675 RepID=A0A1W6B6T2_9GAMM|nr:hypothetical protein [Pantoea alhagi]ARJ42810.1 hypothetical protein B1H58_12750 [Pantoea alhagi]